MEKASVFPDSKFYSSLISNGVYYATQANFRAGWDEPYLLAAVAIDHNGNYSRVFRRKFTLFKDSASPIEELLGVQKRSALGDMAPLSSEEYCRPEKTIVRNKVDRDCRFSDEILKKGKISR